MRTPTFIPFTLAALLVAAPVFSVAQQFEVQNLEQLETIRNVDFQVVNRELIDLSTGQFIAAEDKIVISTVSPEGIFRLLVGAHPGEINVGINPGILQEIPGVPESPRFVGPKYDVIREAFRDSGCPAAAGNYTVEVADLFGPKDGNESFSERLALLRNSNIAPEYEAECLTSLVDTPVGIQRVIGVFSVAGEPFCSGTIIDRETILTAKHCFFDPKSGKETDMNKVWGAGNLAFHTPVKHGRRNLFTVRRPELFFTRVNPFTPHEDQIKVKITKKFSFFATTSATPLDAESYPIVGWIVGSNINLTDLNQPRSIADFVRGSQPKACALLERTESGCLYHSCQTSKSTSGAGFFRLKGLDQYELIAMHKGTVAESKGCEVSAPTDLKLNLAVSLN